MLRRDEEVMALRRACRRGPVRCPTCGTVWALSEAALFRRSSRWVGAIVCDHHRCGGRGPVHEPARRDPAWRDLVRIERPRGRDLVG
jgi:hypothetical protein